jgi:hypothetical protein
MTRPIATLLAAAVGGAGLWLAGHWDTETTGGYWAALGVVAAAGLLLGLAQLRSPDGNAPGMFLVAFVPVAVTAGWVLVSEQPLPTESRDQVREWNRSLGIADVVHYVSPWVAACAFAIGLVLGFTLLAGYAWRRARVTTVEETTAEPVPDTYVEERTAAAPVATGTYDDGRTVVNEPAVADGDRYAADEPTRAERVEADAAAHREEAMHEEARREEAVEPEADADAEAEADAETERPRRRIRILGRP